MLGERLDIPVQYAKVDEGTVLAYKYFDGDTQAGIIFVPGWSEHAASFDHIATKAQRRGFHAFTMDIPGQGLSSGQWGAEHIATSLDTLIEDIKDRHQLTKIGLIGNSVGGMGAALYAAENQEQVDALITTSMPNKLTDIASKTLVKVASKIPYRLFRAACIQIDKRLTKTNEEYAEKTHLQFYQAGKYSSVAQFGATRFPSLKEFAEAFINGPTMSNYASQIQVPWQLMYGGEDRMNGFRRGKLPKHLIPLFEVLPETTQVLMAPGTDHSLNESTPIEASFAQDPDSQYLTDRMLLFMRKHLMTT